VKSRPAVKISALREIGWTYWDPIGLRGMISDDYKEGPVDEYDSYLMSAFGKLCNGKSELEVSIYLDDIASNHMGLGPPDDGGAASKMTAEKLAELMKTLT
jgi:hypothetical protein